MFSLTAPLYPGLSYDWPLPNTHWSGSFDFTDYFNLLESAGVYWATLLLSSHDLCVMDQASREPGEYSPV